MAFSYFPLFPNRSNLDNKQELEKHFALQLQLFKSVSQIYVARPNGSLVLVGSQPDGTLIAKTTEEFPKRSFYLLNDQGERVKLISTDPNYDARLRPWYKSALLKQNWSDIYTFPQGDIGITATQPFYDRSNNLVGIMAVDLTLSKISDFLRTLKISPNGQTFIIERSGAIVASSTGDKLYNMDANQQVKRIQATDAANSLTVATVKHLRERFNGDLSQISQTQQLDFFIRDQRQFVQVLPYKDHRGLDWLAVIVVPEADFMGEINQNTYNTFLLCCAALAVAVVSGYFTSRWIARPIAKLSSASEAIAKVFSSSQYDIEDLNKSVEAVGVNELEVLAQSFNQMADKLRQSFTALEDINASLEERVIQRTEALRIEQEKSEKLLLNILPQAIADRLKQEQSIIADHFSEVTVLFADIVGFTEISSRITPVEIVELLNQVFSVLDSLCEQYNLEKIKTIGDAYMVVGGLPNPREDHAEAIANMALEMQSRITQFYIKEEMPISVRIGINTGAVVAGVIGTKKFIYDLWGDTVNVASRMESQGERGRIQVTQATRDQLKDKYKFERRGVISIKGKGEMATYWLTGKI